MPGKVKVKVLAGRNLPIMDRSNDTTDAYVEVKLGNTTCKTDVCRKSLNPQWNSEWFRFEMDDLELQDEPLQIRLMDYDTYSANDSIGRVYIDLNPLLTNPSTTKEPSGRTLSGWIPVYDTMHGIRGEVNLTVKVELFSDLNKFRQSSCGVKFYFTQGIPEGQMAIQLHGFVEELVVNDDPEYQWIDKIRTPRASNEARQTLFSKLSGEVQRRCGLKALELGGNAVVGYRQCFDLEGESGIVVRGIGTAATLAKIYDPQISPMPVEPNSAKECQSKDRQLAAVSIPKPSSHPSSLNQKPSSPTAFSQSSRLSNKSPTAHSSMPESVLRNLCIQDNSNSLAFDVPLSCVVPTSIAVNVKEQFASTTVLTDPVPAPLSPLGLKDIKSSGVESPSIPYITSPVEAETPQSEKPKSNDKTVGNPLEGEQEGPSTSAGAAAKVEFSGLVLKVSETLKKSITGIHSERPTLPLPVHKRRGGSKKKDKYSTSSLVKRVNPDKPTSFLHNTADEFRKFFSKKRRTQSQRERSPETLDLDELDRDPSPGYSRGYREPKFKRDFLFFRKKKRRGSLASSQTSNLRRSLSDSLSFDRNSLESLPSIQSEDLAYKPDWVQIPTAMRMNSVAERPKVFDPKTVIPESSQPSLSMSSHSSEQTAMGSAPANFTGNNNAINTNTDILEVIRELGYSHTMEKPLQLYISSLDALLVYEPVKNILVDGHELSSACKTDSLLPVIPHPACSLIKISANESNTIRKGETSHPVIGLTSSHSFNHRLNDCEMRMTNHNSLSDNLSCGTTTADNTTTTPTITTHNQHANITTTNRIASEVIENPDSVISCTDPPHNCQPGNSGISGHHHNASHGGGTLGEPNSTSKSASGSATWIPDTIPEDPKRSSSGDLEQGQENGNGNGAVVEKRRVTSGGATSSGGDISTKAYGAQTFRMANNSINKINLVSTNTTKAPLRTAVAGISGRRSSESDLSTPPKGLLNSSIQAMLTSSHGKGTSYAQSRGKVPYIDHFDMLEYPFITISTLPPRFLQRIGGSVSARSVKLLERISNLDEPESRDSWWTELRMEIRSHARSICCNVILGYEEHTTICDDVCILSAAGTAAVVNSAVLGDMSSTEPNLNKPHVGPVPESRQHKGTKEKSGKVPVAKVENPPTHQNGSQPNVPPVEQSGGTTWFEGCELNCSLTHTPYEDFSVPFPVQMSRCGICKKGRVPDLLLATVELPPNIPICGKISLIQAQICRPKKEGKGEMIANEVSDSLPFVEYELHRRLINKLKVRGMNAIFCLRVQICLGDKMIIGVATGTAMCLAGLRPPDLPKIIAGNTKTDTQKVVQFQNVVKDTFERNKIYYMINVSPFAKLHNGNGDAQETEEEEDEEILPCLNLATGNKDTYVLEVDDTEDIEIISDLIDPCSPTGCDMNSMDTVLDYEDAVIVSQQMFTQVWRCRLPNLTLRQLSCQFDRIMRAISFKLRNVQPCIVNKLRFHLELPDSDEMQLSITGTAFGLAQKCSTAAQPSPIPSGSMKGKRESVDEPELIFNLESVGYSANGKNVTKSAHMPLAPVPIIAGVSPTPSGDANHSVESTEGTIGHINSIHLGGSAMVDSLKMSNEGGTNKSSSSIPIPNLVEAKNSNSASVDPTFASTASSSTSPIHRYRLSVSPQIPVAIPPNLNMPAVVPPLSKTVFKSPSSSKGSYVIEMTTLSHIPGYHIEKYLGNLNFFFIRETTSMKEMGGPTGFVHNLIVEVMTVLRAHVAALGGNALVSYFLNDLSLLHNPHKNQGQCLINIGGDAVFITPINQDETAEGPRTNP